MAIFIEKDGKTFANVAKLRAWKDNPKQVHKEDLARLEEQLKMGQHSTLLVTTDGEVLGGNSRLKMYKKTGVAEARVVVVEFKQEKEGVRAIVDGLLAERVFDSVEQAKLEYALSHNDMIGAYDEGKLGELLHLTPIPMEMYKVSSVFRPIEDVAFEAGPAGTSNPEDRPADVDSTDDKLDTFMNSAIKQIVLYFDNDQYEDIIPRMEALRQKYEIDNNTDLFIKMVEECEK